MSFVDGGEGEEEEEEGEEGSLKPRPVMGSVGDSWIVRAFGREVREVEEAATALVESARARDPGPAWSVCLPVPGLAQVSQRRRRALRSTELLYFRPSCDRAIRLFR